MGATTALRAARRIVLRVAPAAARFGFVDDVHLRLEQRRRERMKTPATLEGYHATLPHER